MIDSKFEKLGYSIWIFLIIASVLQGSVVLTLINFLFGWTIPFAGIIIDIVSQDKW